MTLLPIPNSVILSDMMPSIQHLLCHSCWNWNILNFLTFRWTQRPQLRREGVERRLLRPRGLLREGGRGRWHQWGGQPGGQLWHRARRYFPANSKIVWKYFKIDRHFKDKIQNLHFTVKCKSNISHSNRMWHYPIITVSLSQLQYLWWGQPRRRRRGRRRRRPRLRLRRRRRLGT